MSVSRSFQARGITAVKAAAIRREWAAIRREWAAIRREWAAIRREWAASECRCSADRHAGFEMPKRNGPGIELPADPTRRRIIATLAICPRRPSNVARAIGLSRPATSRQLHLLHEAGLVVVNRSLHDGRVLIYRLDPRAHGPITAWLAGTEVARSVALTIDDEGTVQEG